MGWIRSIVGSVLLLTLILFFGSIWLARKSYEFRVKDTDDLGRKWSRSFTTHIEPAAVYEDVKSGHSKVLSEEDFPPLALSTGGLLGSVHLFYASFSEFLLLYHTPFETSGDTGRHFLNMSITVLHGEVGEWNERSGKIIVHGGGKTYRHRIGERGLVRIKEDTYLLVYGRGLVPLTMGYWLWDSLFSSLDPASAIVTVVYYFRAVHSSLDIGGLISWLYDYSWSLASTGVSAIPGIIENILSWISKKAGNLLHSGESIMSD